MKVTLHGIYNTFSVYQQVRVRRQESLRDEARKQFTAVEMPGPDNTIQLHFYKNYESVGILTLSKENDNRLRLKNLCLTQKFQVSGVEQQLMLYAEAWAIDHKYSHTVLFAHALGIPFYLRLGYRQTGETIHENGRLCFKMIKKL